MEDRGASRVLEGRKALVVGVANDQSIAWGCARAFRELGADLAITYLNEKARPHVEPLARSVGASMIAPLDVAVEGSLERVFDEIAARWGSLDLLVHSIAFAPKDDLQGGLLDCSAKGVRSGDGRLVPLLRQDGASCRALDEAGGGNVRDELSRCEQGGAHL
jgi:enoyl-[acyl-carrier-protein] reductase (NADH)